MALKDLMDLLDNVKGMLAQYASGGAPTGDAGAHFQEITQSVDSGTVAQGIAAAMRSDETGIKNGPDAEHPCEMTPARYILEGADVC